MKIALRAFLLTFAFQSLSAHAALFQNFQNWMQQATLDRQLSADEYASLVQMLAAEPEIPVMGVEGQIVKLLGQQGLEQKHFFLHFRADQPTPLLISLHDVYQMAKTEAAEIFPAADLTKATLLEAKATQHQRLRCGPGEKHFRLNYRLQNGADVVVSAIYYASGGARSCAEGKGAGLMTYQVYQEPQFRRLSPESLEVALAEVAKVGISTHVVENMEFRDGELMHHRGSVGVMYGGLQDLSHHEGLTAVRASWTKPQFSKFVSKAEFVQAQLANVIKRASEEKPFGNDLYRSGYIDKDESLVRVGNWRELAILMGADAGKTAKQIDGEIQQIQRLAGLSPARAAIRQSITNLDSVSSLASIREQLNRIDGNLAKYPELKEEFKSWQRPADRELARRAFEYNKRGTASFLWNNSLENVQALKKLADAGEVPQKDFERLAGDLTADRLSNYLKFSRSAKETEEHLKKVDEIVAAYPSLLQAIRTSEKWKNVSSAFSSASDIKAALRARNLIDE